MKPLKSIPLTLSLLFAMTPAFAADDVVRALGYVIYSGSCAQGYAFSYFDGSRLQLHCIADSETVTVRDMVASSRGTDCGSQLRVVSGNVEDGILYAREIAEVHGCSAE